MSDIPRTSRAAVLVDYNKPAEIREIEIPPLEPGAILVKVDNVALKSMEQLQEIKPAILPS